jgi:hypothetical protein
MAQQVIIRCLFGPIYVLILIFRLARTILSANSFKHGPEILIMVIKIESKLLLDSYINLNYFSGNSGCSRCNAQLLHWPQQLH